MLGSMQVEIIRPWRCYRVGDTIYPPGTLRSWLVANKFARLVVPTVTDEPEVEEVAVKAPVVEVAVKRRRGRPRKAQV